MRSDSERPHSRRSGKEREKMDKYINKVYPNDSRLYEISSHAENSIYCK